MANAYAAANLQKPLFTGVNNIKIPFNS